MSNKNRKIAIAITGASGSIYAKILLQKLASIKEQYAEVSIVMSSTAPKVWETELQDNSYTDHPFRSFANDDFNAPFASGSAGYDTMIVVPCSMGTLGRIAGGISNDLITRAADVCLKERRRLLLCVRETPYNLIQIKNMETVTLAGGIIVPATPSFYSRPPSINALCETVVDRLLSLADLEIPKFEWGS